MAIDAWKMGLSRRGAPRLHHSGLLVVLAGQLRLRMGISERRDDNRYLTLCSVDLGRYAMAIGRS